MSIKNNKKLKKHKPLPVIIFKGLCFLLFILVILSLLLCLCTSRKGIGQLANSYVNANDIVIDESYFDIYIEYGLTDNMCNELLNGSELKKIVSDVMTDKFYVLFDYSANYELELSDIKSRVKTIVNDITSGLSLSEEQILTITAYTCDISGISAMYIYDTPAAYRASVFDKHSNEYSGYNSIFETLSILSNWQIPFALIIMFIVCFIILNILLLDYKNILIENLCDTIISPSVICLAFSIGEISLVKNSTTIQDFIFGKLLLISLIGLSIGILLLVFLLVSLKLKSKENKNCPG